MQEFIIEDERKQIDFVYLDYRKRDYDKTGAGRVTYFDLVMLSEESLKHQEDRQEVFNEMNDFGLSEVTFPKKDPSKKRTFGPTKTLGERAKYMQQIWKDRGRYFASLRGALFDLFNNLKL